MFCVNSAHGLQMIKIFLLALLFSYSNGLDAKLLHSEKSLYRNILVEETQGKRCMIFGRRSRYPDLQSCIRFDNPDYLVFSYTKLVLAGLALHLEPKSILIVGLGGGTLPTSLEKLYPKAKIDTVEIDEAVVRVAKKWFAYEESNNQKVHIIDGRVFVKRQNRREQKYDIVILDAFNGDYIPEHLMTQEFLQEIHYLLNEDGLLIANTFSKNKLYDHESMTYQQVFGKFYYVHSELSGNRIIYAPFKSENNDILETINISIQNKAFTTPLTQIGVDFDHFQRLLTNEADWNQSARPLTDQYSPANLLNQ